MTVTGTGSRGRGSDRMSRHMLSLMVCRLCRETIPMSSEQLVRDLLLRVEDLGDLVERHFYGAQDPYRLGPICL